MATATNKNAPANTKRQAAAPTAAIIKTVWDDQESLESVNCPIHLPL